jgi:hypothetical protein
MSALPASALLHFCGLTLPLMPPLLINRRHFINA